MPETLQNPAYRPAAFNKVMPWHDLILS